MAKNEKTSPDIATLASKALRKPGSITKKQIKSLAGAALTQAADTIRALVAPAPEPKVAKPAKAKTTAKPKTAAKPKAAAKSRAAARPKAAKPKAPKPATSPKTAKPKPKAE